MGIQINIRAKNKIASTIVTLLIGGLLLGGGYKFYTLNKRRTAALADQARSQRELEEMESLYRDRAEFLLKWAPSFAAYGFKPEPINQLKVKIQASRALALASQTDFDAFDIKQNEISATVAEFIQAATKQTAKGNEALSPLNHFNSTLMEFERLELKLTRKRAAYHEAAFAERRLAKKVDHLGVWFFKPLALQPVFRAEELLYESHR